MMDLERYNFHWRDGFNYDFPKKRENYDILAKSLLKTRITVITGTRRTGKTTIMKQLMDWLIEHGTPRPHILYYSFDEEQPQIRQIVDEYEKKIGKEIAFSKNKYFLLLDEVQKLDDWQNKVKYFYDHFKNLKIVISGSASLFIKKGVRESLAGRVADFSLGPLSFREYLLFTGKDPLLKDINLHSQILKKEFEKYFRRQYIEIVTGDEDEIRDYAKSILEKVVYVDIPHLVSVENPNILMRLTRIISSNPGMLMEYSKLADTLGQESPVSRMRISNYIHYLEDSYLIKLGYNYSKSGVVSERKLKRAYLSNPSLSYFSDTNTDTGKLVEQTLFLMSGAKFFWRNPQKQEVDIVLESEGKALPVEVKYQNQVSKSDLKGLKGFMKRYNASLGLLISKDIEDSVKTPCGEIRIIPAWNVSLSGFQGF